MLAIAPTIKPDDSGPQVRNLYAAYCFVLIIRDASQFFNCH